MSKTARQKLTDEAFRNQIQRHQECWHRWVDARCIYKKLLNNKPDWFEWLEKQLDGTHYTLNEKTFNEIKLKYENHKKTLQEINRKAKRN